VGVGVCDEPNCVMLQHVGSIPPCFLCSHLLTGVEFLPEIKLLRLATVADIEALPTAPHSFSLMANKRHELECIDQLLGAIRTRETVADPKQVVPVEPELDA